MGQCFGAALLGRSEKAGSILVLFLQVVVEVGGGGCRAKGENQGWGGGADGGGTEVV